MPPVPPPPQPRLAFMYRVEINGLDAGLVEEIQLPQTSSEPVEVSSGGQVHNTKYAGGYTAGDATLTNLMYSDRTNDWAYNKLKTAVDPANNTLGLGSSYKESMTIHHLDNNGEILQSWALIGAWVKDVSYSANNALDKTAKMMETIVLSVDQVFRVGAPVT